MSRFWKRPYFSGLIFGLAVAVSIGWLLLSDRGQGSGVRGQGDRETERGGDKEIRDEGREKKREQFAADRDDVVFDAARAMTYLKDLCKIGPRISGTEGMKKQQEFLKKHFEGLGGKVEMQTFTAKQKSQPRPVDMANMIVSWHPERERRVILCSHYDTRPIADQEPDRRKWQEPFLSANDGGSGVALLMEFAHQMKDLKTEVGVDFVFFDGEEYIFDPEPEHDKYFFGSEHFARTYAKGKGQGSGARGQESGTKGQGTKNREARVHYLGAVLLDMIGGKNPRFPIEQNSWFHAAALVEQLWRIAAAQGCDAFKVQEGPRVNDDHIALNEARIPTVDIIDFDYPHWHRLSDLPENCSGDSMYQVSRVLTAWLKQIR
jgi:glutaminyl-peptide cyclotransferase